MVEGLLTGGNRPIGVIGPHSVNDHFGFGRTHGTSPPANPYCDASANSVVFWICEL
jgi:hypothetical protein